MGDGSIPPASVATLQKVGVWMTKNGASIYGSSACPLPESPWGRCTVSGSTVYLHVISWPSDSVLRVPALQNEARSAYVLADPSIKLKVSRDHGFTLIALPARQTDEADSVIALQLNGPPQVQRQMITQGSDASFDLDYLKAETRGKAVKRFNRDGKFHISKWTGPDDTVTWHLVISQTGKYRIRIRYAAPPDWAGGKYEIKVAGDAVAGTVQATGEGYQYRTFDLGSLNLRRAGECDVTIRPSTNLAHYLMYFESLTLEPGL
jgi:alpha-L-fucosidase